MAEFVPKKAVIAQPESAQEDAENKGFVPLTEQIDETASPSTDAGEFQQKEPKAVDQSSLAIDALKDVEVPAENPLATSEDPEASSPEDSEHQFKVQVIREGEKITKMLVKCKCGETIPLDCIY